MDPPAHIFANRKTLDKFSPEQFIGKALVVDCRDLKEGQAITIDKINIDKANLADFLLFNLGWDKHFKDETYFNDFPYNSRKL
jgi:kynurenine formamidase